MKINPKLAKKPEDLKKLPFKSYKPLLKKILNTFENETSKEEPTDFILMGKYSFVDKATQELPLLILGNWKSEMKNFAKQTVVKRKEKDSLVGKAYYAGKIDGKHTIQLLIWKGKGKEPFLHKIIKKILPKNFVLRFGVVEEDTYQEEPTPDIQQQLQISDTSTTVIEKTGYDVDGNPVNIPANTNMAILQRGEVYQFMAFVNQKMVYLEVPQQELMTTMTVELPTVEIEAKDDYSLERLKALKKKDWEGTFSMFVDVSSAKIVGILKSFTVEEQQAFLTNGGLNKFMEWELNTTDIISAIKDWDIPVVDKLKIIAAERKNRNEELSYETLRPLLVAGDWSDFDIKKYHKLLSFRKNPTSIAAFVRDASIPKSTKKELIQKYWKIAPATNLPQPLYDDLAEKERTLEFGQDAIDAAIRVEEKKAKAEDHKKIITWFHKNALKETHAVLDISEMQLKSILHNYAGGLFQQFKADFLALMDTPYASGYYTLRQAVMNPNPQGGRNGRIQAATVLKDTVQRQLAQKYPIIYAFNKDYTFEGYKKLIQLLESNDTDALQNHLEDKVIDILENIDTVRQELRDNPDYIWALDSIIRSTFNDLGINPKSRVGQIIIAKKEAHQASEDRISMILAGLSVGLGVAAAYASGGLSLLLTAGAAGVGVYDLNRELHTYTIEEAAANVSLAQAKALTTKEPELLWVALAALGALGDVAAAAKVLKNVKIGKIEKLSDVDKYTDKVARQLAIEKNIPFDEAPDSAFQKLKKVVQENAIKHFETLAKEKSAKKELAQKKVEAAWKEFVSPQLYGGTLEGIAANKLAKLTLFFKEAIKAGAENLPEAMNKVGGKVDGLLAKVGIEVAEEQKLKELQKIFEAAREAVRQEQKVLTAAVDNLQALNSIPEEEVFKNQDAIQKAWKEFVDKAPPLEVDVKGKIMPLAFDESGQMLTKNKKGKWGKASTRERKDIYQAMKVEHIAENHTPEVAFDKAMGRVTKKKNGQFTNAPQNGQFTNDETLFRALQFVELKCFDAEGNLDTANLLQKGILELRSQNISKKFSVYALNIPITQDQGKVFLNTQRKALPTWVKNPKFPQPNNSNLEHVAEIPATKIVVIIEEEEGVARIVTMYPQSVKDY
jgi:hypothetical protein